MCFIRRNIDRLSTGSDAADVDASGSLDRVLSELNYYIWNLKATINRRPGQNDSERNFVYYYSSVSSFPKFKLRTLKTNL